VVEGWRDLISHMHAPIPFVWFALLSLPTGTPRSYPPASSHSHPFLPPLSRCALVYTVCACGCACGAVTTASSRARDSMPASARAREVQPAAAAATASLMLGGHSAAVRGAAIATDNLYPIPYTLWPLNLDPCNPQTLNLKHQTLNPKSYTFTQPSALNSQRSALKPLILSQ
jgi:hypothetical protein